ncbi:MAG: glutathione S-transferase family protein [Nitrosomonas sp.]
MGLLLDGKWVDQWYDTASNKGRFVRDAAKFRNWITPNGEAGPSGNGGFKAEAHRYHLYVSLACPWASRTLIIRNLKGLQDFISLSVVNPVMGSEGWTFEPAPGVIADPLYQTQLLYTLYTRAAPDYTGRVTVPVLWDKFNHTIVSNESAEIIRMFNSAFDHLDARSVDFAPQQLLPEIDALNERILHAVNNGVYRAGFATAQEAYEEAVIEVFAMLDELEERLSCNRYLLGDRITEADWRLFTTLIRFDAVYYGHFKCNLRRLIDYTHLWNYTRELYQWPGVSATVNFDHIKTHYYGSHQSINPNKIIPVGPVLDLIQPHRREHLSKR